MEDSYRHKGMRKQLVETLEGKGIANRAVLDAINEVPRHWYLDKAFLQFAYEDKAFPIGEGQTISQPYTVAFQTELLQVERGHKVLEIGTGSGYQTAVLCELGAKVFSIERHKPLFQKAKNILSQLGYLPKLFYGDGYKGQPAFAPFDRILVTCGAPFLPEDLVRQLKPGGRLVIPIGAGDDQVMTLVEKNDGVIEQTTYGNFKFVPMLTKKQG